MNTCKICFLFIILISLYSTYALDLIDPPDSETLQQQARMLLDNPQLTQLPGGKSPGNFHTILLDNQSLGTRSESATYQIFTANSDNNYPPDNTTLCDFGYNYQNSEFSGDINLTNVSEIISITFCLYYTNCNHNANLSFYLNDNLVETISDPDPYDCSCTASANHWPLSYTYSDVSDWDTGAVNNLKVTAASNLYMSYAYVEIVYSKILNPVLTAPDTAYNGQILDFSGSSSYTYDGSTITDYNWDFGDGNTGQGENVQHVYSDEGVYNITMTVTNDNAMQISLIHEITIENQLVPAISLSTSPYYEGAPITFDGTGSYSTIGHEIVDYQWSLSDGSSFNGAVVNQPPIEEGVCTVTLEVTTASGACNTTSTEITVGQSLFCDFTIDSSSPFYEGDSLIFNGSISYSTVDEDITSYNWTFSDGSTKSGRTIKHAFKGYGTGTINLEVTSASGAKDDTYMEIQLEKSLYPVINPMNGSYAAGTPITFSATNSYSLVGNDIVEYDWNFGEDVTGTGVTLDHTFDWGDTHTIYMTVTDESGISRTTSIDITLSGTPQINIAMMPSYAQSTTYGNVLLNEPVTVWGRCWGTEAPFTYDLDFGDGQSTSGTVTDPDNIAVEHTYTTAGSKTVTLTITDSYTRSSKSATTVLRVFPAGNQNIKTNIAIEKGLYYLYRTQRDYNSYSVYWSTENDVGMGTVGSTITAFEENGHMASNDFQEDIYAETVQKGLNYILSRYAGTMAISNHSDGVQVQDSDMDDDGIGIYFFSGSHATYANAFGAIAVAMSMHSEEEARETYVEYGNLAGMSYYDVMVDVVDLYCWSQSDGSNRGGWYYYIRQNSGGKDGSASQWPVLTMKAAHDRCGVPIPQWVKDNALFNFNNLQDSSGGCGYGSAGAWVNCAKTGGMLTGLSFADHHVGHNDVDAGIAYIENNWFQNADPGWGGDFYATYATKKGLQSHNITTLDTPNGTRDWSHDMYGWLMGDTSIIPSNLSPSFQNNGYAFGQYNDGHWKSGKHYVNQNNDICTAHGVLILTNAVSQPLPVAVIADIGDIPADFEFMMDGSSSYHMDQQRSIIRWDWDWNNSDGLNWNNPDATGQRPTNPGYNAVGDYVVTLRVTDDNSTSTYDTHSYIVHVTDSNHPPVAIAIPETRLPSYAGHVGEAITLDASASYDPDDGDYITLYEWDLNGDGVFDDATGSTASVTKNSEYVGMIGLRVTDNNGNVNFNSAYIDITTSYTDTYIGTFTSSRIIEGMTTVDLLIEFHNDAESHTNVNEALVRFYDENPFTTGNRFGDNYIVSLPIGATDVLDISLTIPEGLTRVYAYLDANQNVVEWDETNNLKYVDINYGFITHDDFTIDEDTPTQMNLLANDFEPENLKIYSYTQPEHGTVSSINDTTGLVLYIPDQDYSGDDSFTYYVEHLSYGPDTSHQGNVTIQVDPINDPVVLILEIPDYNKQEDFESFQIDLDQHIEDVDSDISYSFTSNDDEITVSLAEDNHTLIITSVANWNGTSPVSVTATEIAPIRMNLDSGNIPINTRNSVLEVFNVIVTPVDDPPTLITPFPELVKNEDFEDFTFDLANYLLDPDGEATTYEIQLTSGSVECTLQEDEHTLLFGSHQDWFGDVVIEITASSGNPVRNGEISSFSANAIDRATTIVNLNLRVDPVNDDPYLIEEIPDVIVYQDFDEYQINLADYFDDVDNTVLYYEASYDGSVINPQIADSILTISEIINQYGSDDLTLTCSDTAPVRQLTPFADSDNIGRGSASDTFIFTVNPKIVISIARIADANEAGQSGQAEISFTPQPAHSAFVTFSFSGLASLNSDYQSDTSTTFTYDPSNQSSQLINLIPIQDNLLEGLENIIISLDSCDYPNYTIDSNNQSAEILLEDDEPTGTLEISVINDLAEPNTNGLIKVSYENGNPVNDVVFDLLYSNVSAIENNDYIRGESNPITIPGNSTEINIPITVLDDILIEGNEYIDISVDNIQNSIASTGQPVKILVLDNDDDTNDLTIQLITSPAEPDQNGLITLSWDSPFVDDFYLHLSYPEPTHDPATSDVDFSALPDSILFTAGTTQYNLVIPVLDDEDPDPDEQLDITFDGSTYLHGIYTEPQTVNITFTDDDNRAPIALADYYVTEATSLLEIEEIDILSNDSDPDGDDINLYSIDFDSADDTPFYEDTEGYFVYETYLNPAYTALNCNQSYVDSIRYHIIDIYEAIDSTWVYITVNGVNEAPIAQDDSYETSEDINLSVLETSLGLLNNDTDVDNDDSVVLYPELSESQSALNALITYYNDGTFEYYTDNSPDIQALAEGQEAWDSFDYIVHDYFMATDTASVTVHVIGQNDNPVAQDDSFATNENDPINLTDPVNGLLKNDSDVDDGDSFVVNVSTSDQLSQMGASIVYQENGTFTYDPTDAPSIQALAESEEATDTFDYIIDDNFGGMSTATVTITLTGQNDNPVVQNDTYETDENSSIIVTTISSGLLDNDYDVDNGDVVTLNEQTADQSSAMGAIVSCNSDGTFSYDPTNAPQIQALALGQEAWDTFDYSVYDNYDGVGSATVTIHLIGQNDNPVAYDDSYEIDEDNQLIVSNTQLGLLANDTDVDNGDFLSIDAGRSDLSSNLGASISYNSNGTFSYDPTNTLVIQNLASGEEAWDEFSYQMEDNFQGTSSASVSIHLIGRNDNPVAQGDSYATWENDPITITNAVNGLLKNDSDVDNDDSFVVNTSTSDQLSQMGATLVYQEDGTFTYDPTNAAAIQALATDEEATDSFDYIIDDNFGGMSTATVTITLTGQNDNPVAQNDAYETDENSQILITSVSSGLLDNDYDVDNGDIVTLDEQNTDQTSAMGAIVSCNSDGTFSYDPTNAPSIQALALGEDAWDTFDYSVYDNYEGSGSATVTIHLIGQNDNPVVSDGIYETKEDNRLIITNVLLGLLHDASDTDNNDSIIIDIILSDQSSQMGATLVYQEDGTFTYDPTNAAAIQALATDEEATDSFDYIIVDNFGGTATATATITLTGENDNPVAQNDAYETDENSQILITSISSGLLNNDYDVDNGDIVTLDEQNTDQTSAMGAIVSCNSDGTFSYDPTNAPQIQALALGQEAWDTFDYSVYDNYEGTGSATVTVHLIGQNDAPIAINDSFEIDEDHTLNITNTQLGLLNNDTDVDNGDFLVVDTNLSDPTSTLGATIRYNSNGTFTYDPTNTLVIQNLASGEEAWDEFTYYIEDNFEGTASATVTIHVIGRNDIPVAVENSYETHEDSPLYVSSIDLGLLNNDTDVDVNDFLIVDVINSDQSSIMGASIIYQEDGTFTYNPTNAPSIQTLAMHEEAWDEFTYEIDDNFGGTASAIVTVHLIGQNDETHAINDSYSTLADQILNIAAPGLLSNDWDVDETNILTIIDNTATAYNVDLQVSTEGDVSYDPDSVIDFIPLGENQKAYDTFIYTIDDGNDSQDEATVTIEVVGVNDPPEISGTVADQHLTDKETINPFSGVTFFDIDIPHQQLSVDITIENVDKGTFRDNTSFRENNRGTFHLTAYQEMVSQEIQNLVYEPIENYFEPETTEEISFLITVNDGGSEHNVVTDNTSSLVLFSVNDAPVITGTRTNQEVDDNSRIDLFEKVVIEDVDNPDQILQATIIVDAPDHGFFYIRNGFADQGNGVFARTGTQAELTNAISGMKYEPRENVLSPGTFETTNFTLIMNDGIAEDIIDSNTSVITWSVNNFPVFTGITTDIGTTDVEPVNPFSSLNIRDLDSPAQILTVTITSDDADKGSFFDIEGFQSLEDGSLQISGLREEIIPPIRGLIFDPTDNRVTPNTSETTWFTITANDGITSRSNNDTSVSATSVNDLPVIIGTIAGQQTTDEENIMPFTTVELSDIDNPQQLISCEITLINPDQGSILENSFFVPQGNGLWFYTNTANNLTDAIQTLQFIPQPNRITPGSSETALWTVTVNDGFGPVDDNITTIEIQSINNNPQINISQSMFEITDKQSVQPFENILITDVDNPQQNLNVTVTLNNVAIGQLHNMEAFAQLSEDSWQIDGHRGSIIDLLAEIDFQPFENVAEPGAFRDEIITISVNDPLSANVIEQLNISILSINDAPFAIADRYYCLENESLTIPASGVLANDSDVDLNDEPAVVSNVIIESGAELSINSDGSFSLDQSDIPDIETLAVGDSMIITFNYEIVDNYNTTTPAELTIVIQGVNDAPVTNNDAVEMAEDTEFNVDLLANDTDPDSQLDPASLELLQTWEFGEVIIENNGTLTLIPFENYYGSSTLEYQVADESGLISQPAEIDIIVTPVNDAPVITHLDAIEFPEDTQYVVDLFATDIDNTLDELQFTTSANKPQISIEINQQTDQLTIIPETDWFGQAFAQITVGDGHSYDAFMLQIDVTPVDDAPQMNLPETLTFCEDEGLEDIDFSQYLIDIDNPGNLILCCCVNDFIATDINGMLVTISSQPNYFGNQELTFSLKTPEDIEVCGESIEIIVTPVNDAPIVISEPQDIIFDEDIEYQLDISDIFTDTDLPDDELTVTVVSSSNITAVISEGTLIISSQPNWFGVAEITITATDLAGAFADLVCPVTVKPVNDPPLIELPESVTFNEGESLTQDFGNCISDIDNDNLMFTGIATENVALEINIFAVTFTTVDPHYYGSQNVIFTVSDGELSASDTVLVVVQYVNHPPVWTGPVSVSLDEDFGSYDLGVVTDLFTDVDPIEYTNITASISSFDNQLFSAEIDHNQHLMISSIDNCFGNGDVVIEVSDNDSYGTPAQVSHILPIVINPVNDLPWFSDLPEYYEIGAHGFIRINLENNLNDIDDENLILTINSPSGFINVEPESGYPYRFILNATDLSDITDNITLNLNDGHGEIVTTEVEVYVSYSEAPIAQQPLPNQIFNEDFQLESILNLSDYFTDTDSEQLSFNAIVLTEVNGNPVITAQVDNNNDLWLGSNIENWNGNAQVRVICSDPSTRASVSQNININVLPINDNPVVTNSIDDLTIDEDFEPIEIANLTEIFTDVDDAQLNYTLEYHNSEIGLSVVDNILWAQSIRDWNGIIDVTVKASDTHSAYYVETIFHITIKSVYDPAEIDNDINGQIFEILAGGQIIDFSNHINDHNEIEETPLYFTLLGPVAYYEITSIEDNPYALSILPIGSQWAFPDQSLLLSLEGNNEVFVILRVNDAPYIVEELQELSLIYDDLPYSIDLDEYFADPENGEVFYDAIYNEDQIHVDIDNNLLTLNSINSQDYYGSTDITVLASNYLHGDGATVAQTFTLNLTDPSILNLEETFTWVQEEDLRIDLKEYLPKEENTIMKSTIKTSKRTTGISIKENILHLDASQCCQNNHELQIQLNTESSIINMTIHLVCERNNEEMPFMLKSIYPNPLQKETKICFKRNRSDEVSITIYNLKGQKIRTIKTGNTRSGDNAVIWDGKDDNGSKVGSGIYMLSLANGKDTFIRKLMIAK